jgi:23S rRNA (cytidine1920-2'-O)/16S rRNA (cytidine1409-2'-O)-methyltransferase
VAGNDRLDAAVVEKGFATGRDKAKELIRDGAITVNGRIVTKPSFLVSETDEVVCTAEAPRYVGRGGEKLECALAALLPLAHPCVAMDVGASTGGFTHCLLQHGADTVYAVDVGHGQLHPDLRADARVVNLEGTDIRHYETVSSVVAPKSLDLLTMDVSFISVAAVLPATLPFLKDGARLLILIKPQFEVGRADVGKNGIVRDRRAHVRVLQTLCAFFEEQGCAVTALNASPIKGGVGRAEGNIEYVATLVYGGERVALPDVRQVVDDTFEHFR